MNAAMDGTGLVKRYGKTLALDECSFTLPRGRVSALVGPNGAGKTTLLHCAVGLLQPNGGSMQVLGRSPGDPELLGSVGFVAQDAPLYKSFTVEEMLQLGAHTNPRWDDTAARDRFARIGVPLDRKTANLSGGQRAQVALALALSKRPELLLLDEPLASLDPLARRDFLRTLMEAVATDGTTVVLSSHLVTDLERVCDHLMILRDGKIRLSGDIESLTRDHKVLVGPPQERIAGVEEIIEQRGTERQMIALVRLGGAIHDPKWEVQEVGLEDLVLGYLGYHEPDAARRLEAVNG